MQNLLLRIGGAILTRTMQSPTDRKERAVSHPEGAILRAMIAPRVRPVDIARRAGVSRQFVHAVLAGQEKASPKVIRACRELGLPVEAIFGPQGERDAA